MLLNTGLTASATGRYCAPEPSILRMWGVLPKLVISGRFKTESDETRRDFLQRQRLKHRRSSVRPSMLTW